MFPFKRDLTTGTHFLPVSSYDFPTVPYDVWKNYEEECRYQSVPLSITPRYYHRLYQQALQSIKSELPKRIIGDIPSITSAPDTALPLTLPENPPSLPSWTHAKNTNNEHIVSDLYCSGHLPYHLPCYSDTTDDLLFNRRFVQQFRRREFFDDPTVLLSADYLMQQKDKWRRPRTVYTEKQLSLLEKAYENNKYLRGKDRKELCKLLKLEERHVKVWYQNRRAKERTQIRHDKWLQRTKKYKKNEKDQIGEEN